MGLEEMHIISSTECTAAEFSGGKHQAWVEHVAAGPVLHSKLEDRTAVGVTRAKDASNGWHLGGNPGELQYGSSENYIRKQR